MAEIVIENLGQLRQTMDAARWFAAIRRAAPRALVPLTVALRQTAPRPQVRRRPGTARLGDRFDVAFVEDVQQGLVKGVSVAIAARVPYASPVASGHRIVPRGPSRSRLGPARRVRTGQRNRAGRAITELDRRTRRGVLRRELQVRRAQAAFGVFGRVPGNPFVTTAVAQARGQVLALIQKLVAQELRLGAA